MENKILMLDEHVAQKIAAGEVIERPASIVKELIENSIDAGATYITVEIKNGGKDYIRITDNGCGIAEDDLKLAFIRHATSKLRSFEDFETLLSMGFRGEALYSIAAVSKVDMITKTANAISGNRILVCGGNTKEFCAAGCPDGTTIIIEDLFFNTSARKKFLSKDATESQHISTVIQNFILSYPAISIKFISNGALIYQSRGDGSQKSAVFTIFGKEVVDHIFEFNGEYNSIHAFGYLGGRNIYRSSRSHQYIFLNHRPIRDNMISSIIENIYSNVLMKGRYPFFILNVNMDPKLIDVNVHPQKQTVKFSDVNTVKTAVANAVSDVAGMINYSPASVSIHDTEQLSQLSIQHDNSPRINGNRLNAYKPVQNMKSHDYKSILREKARAADTNTLREPVVDGGRAETTENPKMELEDDVSIIGTVFHTYILLVIGETLYMIDQHAAHERLLYERYIEQFRRSSVDSQMMLVPDVIELSYDDKLLLDQNIHIIRDMGFDIDGYGGNSYIVRSIPAVLRHINVSSYIVSAAGMIPKDGVPEEVKARLISHACKSAVKGGERLSREEVAELIRYIANEEVPLSCPHGRPFVVKMDKKQMDRMFGRIN